MVHIYPEDGGLTHRDGTERPSSLLNLMSMIIVKAGKHFHKRVTRRRGGLFTRFGQHCMLNAVD
jgi:hypothetical protein